MQFKPLVGLSYEFVFTLVNTVVLFLVLRKILFKKVLGIIDDRKAEIAQNLQKGEQAKQEGLKFKSEYENKVGEARNEGQMIVDSAKKRAEEKSEQIILEAKNEAIAIKAKASMDIERERQQTLNEVKDEISNIAIMAASKVIENDIDKSKHEELINEFINEIGDVK